MTGTAWTLDPGADVNDAVDAAYRAKYGRYVEPMVRPEARATTLKLLPRDEDRS